MVSTQQKGSCEMSFWNKVKEQANVVAGAAGSVAQTAAKQTKALAAIGRVKLSITAEEDKIKRSYIELGRLFYQNYENATDIAAEDYQPWCDRVTDAKVQISRLNEELAQLRAEAQATDEIEIEVVVTDDPTTECDITLEKTSAETIDVTEPVPSSPVEDVAIPLQEDVSGVPQPPVVGTFYVDVTDTEE